MREILKKTKAECEWEQRCQWRKTQRHRDTEKRQGCQIQRNCDEALLTVMARKSRGENKKNHIEANRGIWAAGSWWTRRGHQHVARCRHWCSSAPLDCSEGTGSHSQRRTQCYPPCSPQRRSHPGPGGQNRHIWFTTVFTLIWNKYM